MTLLLHSRRNAVEDIILSYPATCANVTCIQLQPTVDLFFLGESNAVVNEQMTNDDADRNFYKFLSKRHFACENNTRLGNALDGGWDICLAEPYRPKPPCLVYSFGINNDFSFDDAIAAKFNCTVRCFDPSMSAKAYRRSSNVWFYRIGIDGYTKVSNKGWKLNTLSKIIKSLNDTNAIIDYLKIDVEGSEWPSLAQMLSAGTLSKVKQLGMELHIKKTNTKSFFGIYMTLKQLEDQGFRRWHFALNLYRLKQTANGFRSCCYEMVYINTNFLK